MYSYIQYFLFCFILILNITVYHSMAATIQQSKDFIHKEVNTCGSYSTSKDNNTTIFQMHQKLNIDDNLIRLKTLLTNKDTESTKLNDREIIDTMVSIEDLDPDNISIQSKKLPHDRYTNKEFNTINMNCSREHCVYGFNYKGDFQSRTISIFICENRPLIEIKESFINLINLYINNKPN